jgi:hypothetical protein
VFGCRRRWPSECAANMQVPTSGPRTRWMALVEALRQIDGRGSPTRCCRDRAADPQRVGRGVNDRRPPVRMDRRAVAAAALPSRPDDRRPPGRLNIPKLGMGSHLLPFLHARRRRRSAGRRGEAAPWSRVLDAEGRSLEAERDHQEPGSESLQGAPTSALARSRRDQASIRRVIGATWQRPRGACRHDRACPARPVHRGRDPLSRRSQERPRDQAPRRRPTLRRLPETLARKAPALPPERGLPVRTRLHHLTDVTRSVGARAAGRA